MQIYYASLDAIEQQTRQLDHEQCSHCQQTHQLVSHGFIYKKQAGADPAATGKRVLCSNRHHHAGCGRTTQLYLDTTVRYLHYAGSQVVAFVFALIAGASVTQAYWQSTGSADTHNAYRWLHRLGAQLSTYRSLSHRPALADTEPPVLAARLPLRTGLLASTFQCLLQQFGQPLCGRYQGHTQRSFL